MQSVPLTGVPVFSSKNVCRGAKRPRSRAHLHLGRFRIARAASDDLEIVAVAEHVLCRTPHGVRGLKYSGNNPCTHLQCRTLHGVRGLKYLGDQLLVVRGAVAPRAERPQRQTPRTANAVRGVHIKGRHALPKERDRKRADTVAQREKRYHERSKRDLWACTLPNEGVCSA